MGTEKDIHPTFLPVPSSPISFAPTSGRVGSTPYTIPYRYHNLSFDDVNVTTVKGLLPLPPPVLIVLRLLRKSRVLKSSVF